MKRKSASIAKKATGKKTTAKKTTAKTSTARKTTARKTTAKKKPKTLPAGQVALSGFAMQVVFAVLDGLTTEDWISLTVEPHDDDGSRNFQKVDIRWVLSSGDERHDQVKTSRRSFGKADIKWWAEELASTSDAATKRLVLVGPVSAGVQDTAEHEGVSVRIVPRGEYAVEGAICHHLTGFCERHGVHITASHALEMHEKLLGLLLLGSATGKTWTKGEFTEDILALARAEDRYPKHKEGIARLLMTLFSKDGLLKFMTHVDGTLSRRAIDMGKLRELPESTSFFK